MNLPPLPQPSTPFVICTACDKVMIVPSLYQEDTDSQNIRRSVCICTFIHTHIRTYHTLLRKNIRYIQCREVSKYQKGIQKETIHPQSRDNDDYYFEMCSFSFSHAHFFFYIVEIIFSHLLPGYCFPAIRPCFGGGWVCLMTLCDILRKQVLKFCHLSDSPK